MIDSSQKVTEKQKKRNDITAMTHRNINKKGIKFTIKIYRSELHASQNTR